jgi:hypothetical protein
VRIFQLPERLVHIINDTTKHFMILVVRQFAVHVLKLGYLDDLVLEAGSDQVPADLVVLWAVLNDALGCVVKCNDTPHHATSLRERTHIVVIRVRVLL